MKNFQSYRSCELGRVDESMVDQKLTLCGFVERRRDHGDVVFVDLRDRYGVVQCVIAPDISKESVKKFLPVRKEWVVSLTGTLKYRAGGNYNEKMKSGKVELLVEECEILSEAEATPIFVADEIDSDEITRMRYRYLDLRRNPMMKKLEIRHRVVKLMRDFLDDYGFLEVETPMLTKATPEGARDFLVPSRMNPGKFYALPQSPQIFKQILMVSGVDRYFQVARCFRDEDLRGDRQPEFTQVDIEVSFAKSDDLMTLMENMVAKIFGDILNVEVPLPLKRMDYATAMERYGCDKPDTRFEMLIEDATELLKGSEFGVINSTIESGGRIRGICAERFFSRKELKNLESMVATFDAKGIMALKIEGGEYKGPLSKFFSQEQLAKVVELFGGKDGDTILLIAGPDKVTSPSLSKLRLHIGDELGLIDHSKFNFLWLIDPPLVEFDEDENRFTPVHHPFTAPKKEDIPLLSSDISKVKADAYDLILNGNEIAGGSVRIHDKKLQREVFEKIGLSMEDIEEKFGFMLEAFRYGVPPHAGIAFGLARLLMLMTNSSSIRDVIAFPKTTSGLCPMTSAPTEIPQDQLDEVSITVKKRENQE